MKPRKPLAKYPVVTTNSVERAEFCIGQRIAEAQIICADDRHDFQLEMNAVGFEGFSLMYNRFGSRTILSAGPDRGHVIFVTSVRVPIELHIDDERYVVSQNEAAVVASANHVRIERPAQSETLYLRIPFADLWAHFENLTARHHRGTLVFDPQVNVLSGPGALLKRLMDYLVEMFAASESVTQNPIIRKSYSDLLKTAILSLPHNKVSQLYEDRSRLLAPAVVRRAEEYMRANLQKPVTVADLVRVCKCSRSALFATFRNTRNYTPMEFLTEQRLLNARKQLLRAKPQVSASSIAIKCGFISYGWFFQAYKKRFGERPSDTLRIAKWNKAV